MIKIKIIIGCKDKTYGKGALVNEEYLEEFPNLLKRAFLNLYRSCLQTVYQHQYGMDKDSSVDKSHTETLKEFGDR